LAGKRGASLPSRLSLSEVTNFRYPVVSIVWGRGEGCYRVLVRKPEGRRPLGRPRRRREVNIGMDLLELGAGCGDWMELAHDRDR